MYILFKSEAFVHGLLVFSYIFYVPSIVDIYVYLLISKCLSI